MSVWSQIGATVLGGLLSAGAGIVATRYELRRREKHSRREWYENLLRLADQVKETANTSSDRYYTDVAGAHLGEIADLLRRHVANSPTGISPEVIAIADELAYYCEEAEFWTSDSTRGQGNLHSAENNAIETVKKLRKHIAEETAITEFEG